MCRHLAWGLTDRLRDSVGDQMVLRAFDANRIGRCWVVSEHKCLASTAAQILLALLTTRARLFHPTSAAIAIETFGIKPYVAQAVVPYVWKT